MIHPGSRKAAQMLKESLRKDKKERLVYDLEEIAYKILIILTFGTK